MPIITDGVYELLDKENESVYAYLRKGEKETLLVVGNFTDKTINYHIEEKVQAKKSRLLISNYNAAETFERDLSLEPYGHAYICWKQRNKEIIFPYNAKK